MKNKDDRHAFQDIIEFEKEKAFKKGKKVGIKNTIKKIRDWIGDPGEVNGPWMMGVKPMIGFLKKLEYEK